MDACYNMSALNKIFYLNILIFQDFLKNLFLQHLYHHHIVGKKKDDFSDLIYHVPYYLSV